MSSLFAIATVFDAVGVAFPADVIAELKQIPGTAVAKTGLRAWVPPTAAFGVAEMLSRHGVVAGIKGTLPRHYNHETSCIETARLSRASELHSWVWDDPETSPPTATEPIRLLPFQRDAIAFAVGNDSVALWESAGAGKTVQGLAWALAQPGAVLVITRAGARETHRRETLRLTSLVPFVFLPKSRIRKRDQFQSIDSYLEFCTQTASRPFVIVAWEMLGQGKREDGEDDASEDASVLQHLMSLPFVSIIFDELHRGKNQRRKRWVPTQDNKLEGRDTYNTSSVAHILASKARRRLGTTATPIGHRLSDLWGQVSLIEPWSWGPSASRFLFRYCDGKDGEFGGVEAVGMSNVDELKTRLGYTVYHVPKHVSHAQLPAKRREVIRVSAADQVNAKRWTAKTIKDAVMEAKTGSHVAKARVQQLRLAEASARKRRYIINDVKAWLADQPNAKILIFTGLIQDCDDLGTMLETAGGKLGGVQVWAASGTTAGDVRSEIQDAYMAHPGPCILVGTYKAWGESLNLQDTDLLLVSMLPWTVDMVIQLEGRVHRIGMLRKVLIRYLIAEDTYDERIADILLSKLPAVEAFTGDNVEGFGDQLSGIDFDLSELSSMYGVV